MFRCLIISRGGSKNQPSYNVGDYEIWGSTDEHYKAHSQRCIWLHTLMGKSGMVPEWAPINRGTIKPLPARAGEDPEEMELSDTDLALC